MSDKKKPNGDKVNDNVVTIPVASKGAKFADKLNKIFGLFSELKNDTTGAVDFEKTLEENTALKTMLRKRDEEIKQLNSKLIQADHTLNKTATVFGETCGNYDTRLKTLSSVNEELKGTRARLEKMSEETKTLEAENRQLKKAVSDAEATRKKVETMLATTEQTCRRLKYELADVQQTISFYGEETLVDIDPVGLETHFERFHRQCHDLVMGCFWNCEAPPSNINQLEAHVSGRANNIPLLPSTSPAARLIRAACAEAVIMNAIVNHVFADIYLPGYTGRQKEVSSTLALLAELNPRREALVRCQFLAEFVPSQEVVSSVMQAAFKDICFILDSLLPAGPQQDRFHTELAGLLQSAVTTWIPLQASRNRVVVDFSMNMPDLDRQEDFYSDFDKATAENGTPQPSSPGATHTSVILMLFPLILMDGNIMAGPKALWSDQAALIEAREEVAADSARSNRLSSYGAVGLADGHRQSSHPRRQSVSGRPGGLRSSVAAASSTATQGAMSPSTATKLGSPGLGRRVENGVKPVAGKKE